MTTPREPWYTDRSDPQIPVTRCREHGVMWTEEHSLAFSHGPEWDRAARDAATTDPEPAAPPPAPTDDVAARCAGCGHYERLHDPAWGCRSYCACHGPEPAPADDVAASYFDTLRGSIADPDVLAAAAKAEADRPAPTDDVAAMLESGKPTNIAPTDDVADDAERLYDEWQTADSDVVAERARDTLLDHLPAVFGRMRRLAADLAESRATSAMRHGMLGAARERAEAAEAEAERWKADALRAVLDTEEPA